MVWVVIGGGIAGVSCVQSLLELQEASSTRAQIVLISASDVVKQPVLVEKHGKTLELIQLKQSSVSEFTNSSSLLCKLQFMRAFVTDLDPKEKILKLKSNVLWIAWS
jgi:NADH dehydrogenase FAD-containing subunit